MSKLLKKVIDKHMPHLSGRLTADNGYDEAKHLTVADLHKAKVISDKEKSAIDDCIDDLAGFNVNSADSNAAKALKAVDSGEVKRDSLNDDEFIKALFGGKPKDGNDVDQDDDEDITA